MKTRLFTISVLIVVVCSGLATIGSRIPTIVGKNAEARISQILTVQASGGYTVALLTLAVVLAISLAGAWLFLKRKIVVQTGIIAIILVAAMAVALTPIALIHNNQSGLSADSHSNTEQRIKQNQLGKFSSYEELEQFVRNNSAAYYGEMYAFSGSSVWKSNTFFGTNAWAPTTRFIPEGTIEPFQSGSVAGDYSMTNIQVQGVDEADIVKTDGRYIYAISGNTVVIIDAYPAENSRILSQINMGENPLEIFVNENKLIVFGPTFVKVYDVSNIEKPTLSRDVSFDGNYFDSRMIGNYVYVIVSLPIYCQENIALPKISSDDKSQTIPANEIYYFNVPDYSYSFTTIISVNTQNDSEEISKETFLIGAAQTIFVSTNNIYITNTTSSIYFGPAITNGNKLNSMVYPETTEETIVHKISIADGKIGYESWGEVPGTVLDQFSMDEYQGYFRIATTTGWMENNNVYVLDNDLKVVGKLEGFAPGEEIYSARFMGNRAYIVTFKKIDPFFVIDLKDPENPTVLGELKIPGFSDYLHPYDENHIIGLGKNAVDEGSFAWYQGVKIALFDVSDPQNPVEISNYAIGDRGTDSYALTDHLAFLFSPSKNLLVIPISLAKINENEYPEGVPPYAYGNTVWQGAYVFNVSLENGFVFRGGITHMENFDYSYTPYPLYYPYLNDNSVKRSFYIGDVLYTISDKLVKMNNLEDLSEINEVALPGVSYTYGYEGQSGGMGVITPQLSR